MVRFLVTLSSVASLIVLLCWAPGCGRKEAETTPAEPDKPEIGSQAPETAVKSSPQEDARSRTAVEPQPLSAAVKRGLVWLVRAQQGNGGWGAGAHTAQQIRDPKAVKTDPATTAFAAMALLRADDGRLGGAHGRPLESALAYLVDAIEKGPDEGALITRLTGTQPQTKLGASIDTAMAAQFLARTFPLLPEKHALKKRVSAALDRCIEKLEGSQLKSGTWKGGGGWAPVLQASMGCQALELSRRAGKRVNAEVLKRARDYQQGNLDTVSGAASTREAAGVELYSAAGAYRAMAPRAARAALIIQDAKAQGKLEMDADISEASLELAGVADSPVRASLADASSKTRLQTERFRDESMLRGLGSNGGEEYLSYMMTSESFAMAGGKEWTDWNEKMHKRLAKIQNADGSWSGHHCITSPVFCTAAVVQTLTVDRDAAYLISLATEEGKAGAR